MTQQTIDIAGAEIPVPGPTLVSIRDTLAKAKAALRVAFEIDDAQEQIEGALQRWGSAEIQRRAAAAEQAEASGPEPNGDVSPAPEDPPTAT